jgi:LacI family transcriptional regulator
MKPATIKEIARRLGVNPSTVSRALAGSTKVSTETRERVMRLAQELNYTPNLWAQNLVGTSSNLIGCLVLELSNPFYVPVVRAIQSVASQKDYIVFLGESQRQLEVEKAAIERFRRIRVAGIIATPVLVEVEHLRLLEKEGVPVVLLGRSAPGFYSVNVDNRRSGEIVGRHLIRCGHRAIGYVYSGEAHNLPELHRLEGLKRALAEADLNLEHTYIVGRNDLGGGEKAARRWLAQSQRPTAVFCSNDMLAMGFISALLAEGVHVPGDVAVVGHDDVPFASLFKVELTTVAIPKEEVGRTAINILLDRIEGGSASGKPLDIVLEPSLVVRQSCGGRS